MVNLTPNVSYWLDHELSGFQCGGHSLPVDSGVLAQAGGQWGQYEQYRGTLLGPSLKAENFGQEDYYPPVWTAHPLSHLHLDPQFGVIVMNDATSSD